MFPDLQTDLYDTDSVENDLRHSAKGSLDAYDATHSLTLYEKSRIIHVSSTTTKDLSHYDTITIGPKEKFHWVMQLINIQKEKLFDSHEEKFLNMQRSPNKPNQSQNQSVIDQGHLITRKTCLLLKVKRPVLMRSMKNVFTKNVFSDRSGQPDITPSVIRAHSLSENTRVEQTHDRSGQPDERNSSKSTHGERTTCC